MTWTAENWPIACPMAKTDDPCSWERQMREIALMDFTAIDPAWLPIGDLTESMLDDFDEAAQRHGLSVPAISILRRSVVDTQHGDDNLAYAHRVIECAAKLGAKVVSVGFYQDTTPAQDRATWFWLEPGHRDSADPAIYALAVERIRELAGHAESLGVQISLEMFENTYLGSSHGCVSFVRDVDHPACGLNPDLGNLVRLHRPLEPVSEAFEAMLPYTNYWHIKNYYRDEDPATGAYATHPSPLSQGYINYRAVVTRALELGYEGPFMVEHYGADSLENLAESHTYLRRLLRHAILLAD